MVILRDKSSICSYSTSGVCIIGTSIIGDTVQKFHMRSCWASRGSWFTRIVRSTSICDFIDILLTRSCDTRSTRTIEILSSAWTSSRRECFRARIGFCIALCRYTRNTPYLIECRTSWIYERCWISSIFTLDHLSTTQTSRSTIMITGIPDNW